MNRAIRAGLLFTAIVALVLAAVPAPHAVAGDEAQHATFTISGMTCGGCVGAVKTALKKTKGVTEYEVSLEAGEATVTFNPAETSVDAIADAITKTGFTAKVKAEEGAA
jgi:copper chaperone CopZ